MAFIVMVLRVSSAISLQEPLHLVTSGWEQQPLMGLWLWANGLPIFNDYFKLPYYSAHYNWLFYGFYGEVILGVLSRTTSAPFDWLPTIARLTTLAALPFIAWLTYRNFISLCKTYKPMDGFIHILCVLFALHIAVGPLIGFWAITARPDVWALTFEVAALVIFWNKGKRSFWPLIAAAACAYLAWALKHNSVIPPITIVLFAIISRRYLDAALFSGILVSAYSITFLVASEHYLPSLMQAKLPFLPETGVRNFVNFAQKSAPQFVGLLGLVGVCILKPSIIKQLLRIPTFQFVGILVCVCFFISIPASTKEGAAENYYFLASFAMAALTVLSLHVVPHITKDERVSLFPVTAITIGWGLHSLALVGLLSGTFGVLSVSSTHDSYKSAQKCMALLPRPIHSSEMYLQLPWMNPSSLLTFTTYNYPLHQSVENSPYERSGVGGLVREKAFASLFLGGPVEALDGAPLIGYERQPTPCAGRTVYHRIAN